MDNGVLKYLSNTYMVFLINAKQVKIIKNRRQNKFLIFRHRIQFLMTFFVTNIVFCFNLNQLNDH
jgi:hypothetical protein